MNNKFSFFTLPKSAIIDNNSQLEENEKSANSNSEFEDISLYAFEDDSFIEEYCYNNGNCNLYCDVGNNSLALLYSTNNDDSIISIYEPEGAYIAQQSNSKIERVAYIDKKHFLSLEKSTMLPKKLFTVFNSVIVVYDGVHKIKEMYDKFNKLNLKYSIMSKYIPASCIIDSIIDKINHYTVTRELNKDELLDDYSKLQNFQELCYDSIYRISDFITNPSHTDLRKLSDNLYTNSTNISKLMDLYLIDEFEQANEDR